MRFREDGMAKRGDPSVLRFVVIFLRSHTGMTQKKFGKACRLDQAQISKYEKGSAAPSEEALRRMANVAGIEWALVVHLRQFYSSLLAQVARPSAASASRTLDLPIREPILLAVTPYLIEAHTAEQALPSLNEERRIAEQIWTALERHPVPFRRRLIELSPNTRNWTLALRVCEASVERAAHEPREALELADLALFIAERVPGEESWRSRLKGYCRAHVANARRVANDLAGADEAFALAWDLWRAGTGADPDLLGDWVLPSMEASLRRDQGRFSEALELLDQAKASQGGTSPAALVILLLQKEHIFGQMGDTEGALAALTEAAPFVEASGDARQLFALRFNVADDLCQLKRYEEAAKLLPQVRELAVQQGNELDLLRVLWLSAKLAAGQGRMQEAVAGLEQVSRDFLEHDMPYDAALSSLDLAVLWLKAGRTAEVRGLAVAMGKIFNAKEIDREALAALRLFCDAARQEAATVELARQVIQEIEQVRRSVSPPGVRRDRG
jgi:transcriptional regulator with XRE-family HTH domain